MQCTQISTSQRIFGLQCALQDGHAGPHSYENTAAAAREMARDVFAAFDKAAAAVETVPEAPTHWTTHRAATPQAAPMMDVSSGVVVLSKLAYEILTGAICVGCRQKIPTVPFGNDIVHVMPGANFSMACLATKLKSVIQVQDAS